MNEMSEDNEEFEPDGTQGDTNMGTEQRTQPLRNVPIRQGRAAWMDH